MAPRTIDNLGIDASTRYAEDKKNFDETLIKEAPSIPIQIEIEVTSSFFPVETQDFLQLQPSGISWALFSPPTGYFEQKKRLFTFQLIPSLGSEDKQESQTQKILTKLKSIQQQTKLNEVEVPDRRQQYENERALEQEEKEKNILTSLLGTITQFDKVIIEINSRRTQYQKG